MYYSLFSKWFERTLTVYTCITLWLFIFQDLCYKYMYTSHSETVTTIHNNLSKLRANITNLPIATTFNTLLDLAQAPYLQNTAAHRWTTATWPRSVSWPLTRFTQYASRRSPRSDRVLSLHRYRSKLSKVSFSRTLNVEIILEWRYRLLDYLFILF